MARRPYAYIRRSVSRKNDEGDVSKKFQMQAVRGLAGKQAKTLVMLDKDWGKSAATENTDRRLAFLGLMEDVEAGKVSTLYAYSADRLARSVEWSSRLWNACARTKTAIVTTSYRFEPWGDDDAGWNIWHYEATANESTLRGMKRKARSGSATRRARGDEFGSSRYGYVTNAATRGKDERVAWVRDPSVPLDRVLEVVRENDGNILKSCTQLEAEGVASPRGKKRWSTSALTRVVERESPELRVKKRKGGQRTPTKSVLSGLVRCPFCEAFMTPVGTRNGLYCRFGYRERTSHPKYFTKDHSIMELLHRETDGRTYSTVRFVEATGDTKAYTKAEERWRRANVRYQHDGISDGEYEAEAKRWEEAKANAPDGDDVWNLEHARGKPYVRWGDEPNIVNEDLRRNFTEVKLDASLKPIEAVWRWRHMRRAKRTATATRSE